MNIFNIFLWVGYNLVQVLSIKAYWVIMTSFKISIVAAILWGVNEFLSLPATFIVWSMCNSVYGLCKYGCWTCVALLTIWSREGHIFMGVIEITFMHLPRGQKPVASEPQFLLWILFIWKKKLLVKIGDNTEIT